MYLAFFEDSDYERLLDIIKREGIECIESIHGDKNYIKSLAEFIKPTGLPEDSNLTPREKEVLALIRDGLSNREISRKLFLSEKTVKNHLNNIFKKIEVTDRTNAALFAIKNGI